MSDCTRWSMIQQIDWFRSQFAQHESLPFSEVLPECVVDDGLRSLGVRFYDSLYNPVTAFWLFLGQVIHTNPTLAVTVESFLAWRLRRGMSPCSTDTGGYARARKRLPETLLALFVRQSGRALEQATAREWRWLGKAVKLFDGSTVSMPDTPKNQADYPQLTRGESRAKLVARAGPSCSCLANGHRNNTSLPTTAGKPPARSADKHFFPEPTGRHALSAV